MHWEIRLYIGSIIISPLFISLQWGLTSIEKDTSFKIETLPITWNEWGKLCLCSVTGVNNLDVMVVWDDQYIDRNTSKAVFRVANPVKTGQWVSYLYIGK